MAVFTPAQAGWVFHVLMKDEPFIFFCVVFSHLFRYVRISFGVTWQTLQWATANGCVAEKETSCRGCASFSQVSCHTPTLSAGWPPDSQRLITDMKTSPTVYLIKSILTAAQLPSAFNYDSFANVPAEYQSQCCIAFFFSFEGLLVHVLSCCRPHTSHTKSGTRTSSWTLVASGHFCTDRSATWAATDSHASFTECGPPDLDWEIYFILFFLHDVGPLRSERCSRR